jgi:hypothetical protein
VVHATPAACPRCGSTRVAQIAHGLIAIDDGVRADLDASRIVLGGCSVSEDSPLLHCVVCGNEWGELGPPSEADLAEARAKEERLEAEARARGVMQAPLYPDGWVLCPHCSRSFDTTSNMSWTGERHVTCRTWLRLEKVE